MVSFPFLSEALQVSICLTFSPSLTSQMRTMETHAVWGASRRHTLQHGGKNVLYLHSQRSGFTILVTFSSWTKAKKSTRQISATFTSGWIPTPLKGYTCKYTGWRSARSMCASPLPLLPFHVTSTVRQQTGPSLGSGMAAGLDDAPPLR